MQIGFHLFGLGSFQPLNELKKDTTPFGLERYKDTAEIVQLFKISRVVAVIFLAIAAALHHFVGKGFPLEGLTPLSSLVGASAAIFSIASQIEMVFASSI